MNLQRSRGMKFCSSGNPIVLFWYGAMQKWARVAICRLIHAPLHMRVYYGDDRPSVKLLNLNQVITVLE